MYTLLGTVSTNKVPNTLLLHRSTHLIIYSMQNFCTFLNTISPMAGLSYIERKITVMMSGEYGLISSHTDLVFGL